MEGEKMKINRRQFVNKSLTVTAGLGFSSLISGTLKASPSELWKKPIPLGKSGISIPRLAMGSGSSGWRKTSKQKKLGNEKFETLVNYAYDRGLRFFETADTYGTHEFLGNALKDKPREDLTLMTKIWNRENREGWLKYDTVLNTLDRFRKELKTDYFDIVLLHCQVEPNWNEKYKPYMDGLAEAKEKGIIRAHGVSCHDWESMKTAANSDWVDIILARINDNGARLDNKPDVVMNLLKKMHDNRQGVIGMKLYGGGKTTGEKQRQSALEYVYKSGNVDSVTIGFTEQKHIDDTINRVENILTH